MICRDIERLDAHAFAETGATTNEYPRGTVRAVWIRPWRQDFIRFEDRDQAAVTQSQSDIGARSDETCSAQLVQIRANNDWLTVDRIPAHQAIHAGV